MTQFRLLLVILGLALSVQAEDVSSSAGAAKVGETNLGTLCGNLPICPTCCDPEEAFSNNGYCPDGAVSSPKSRVYNSRYDAVHTALDYVPQSPLAGSGCSPCGSSGTGLPAGVDLPRFALKRIHRYRDITWQSSFGPGVFS